MTDDATNDECCCAGCGQELKLPIGNVEGAHPGILVVDGTRPQNCVHFVHDFICLRRWVEVELTLKTLAAMEK